MVLSARRIKVRVIGKATGISQCTISLIFHENLDVKKISARLLPRFLTLENICKLVVNSKAVLTLFLRNPEDFPHQFINFDEIWINQYTTETK